MSFIIRFSPQATDHLRSLTGHQRATALDAIERQLSHQPTMETRNRKRMQQGQPGFVAPWELRVGDLRVYYDVMSDAEPMVQIVAVGIKVRDRTWIGGEEFEP